MRPDLKERATDVAEQMDDPDCDLRKLERTYARFAAVNAVVAGWRRMYLRRIRPVLRTAGEHRLLDVGTGGADLPRTLLRWAQRDGLRLTAVGIDPDNRAIRWARSRPCTGLDLQVAHTSDLVANAEQFNIVVSHHVLHHLSPGELVGLLRDSLLLLTPSGIAVHTDIARSRSAYAAFATGTALAAPALAGSYIRADGLTSIRRSYTIAELTASVPEGWSVTARFPGHLELSNA